MPTVWLKPLHVECAHRSKLVCKQAQQLRNARQLQQLTARTTQKYRPGPCHRRDGTHPNKP
jgi:hypothetical protein